MRRPGSSSIAAPVSADRLIDGDYQDGRALEFGGRKTGVVLGKVLAAGRVTAD
jgi:hypothetical protein